MGRRALAGLALVACVACALAALSSAGKRRAEPVAALETTAREIPAPEAPPAPAPEVHAVAPEPTNARTAPRPDDPAALPAALAQLAAIRAQPGAAPLVDDIVAYIRRSPPGTVSLAHLPRASNGLAVLDERSAEAMIPDPEIRRKWAELGRILARAHRSHTMSR